MLIEKSIIDIKNLTTMHLPAMVTVFHIKNQIDVFSFFENPVNSTNTENIFILGGGSNLIISPEIKNKTILKIEIKGIDIISENNEEVLVKIGAGENWDDFVLWSVNNNYSGVEALSAIPGNVGATPVQNVGAYGIEIKDVLASINAYDTELKKVVNLNNDECDFSYRNSIFKEEKPNGEKGRYIILDITLKLNKVNLPNNIKIPDYEAVRVYLKEKDITNPSLLDIRNAIIDIRWSKLPHPEILPNCGSFFKNPIIKRELAEKIKEEYIDLPIFEINANTTGSTRQDLVQDKVKVSAGYLIEKLDLKGFDFGNVKTYEKNALVLVNHNNASYNDIVDAKNIIIEKVKNTFNIDLETEPEFV